MTTKTRESSETMSATISGVFDDDDSFGRSALQALTREYNERAQASSLVGQPILFGKVDLKKLAAGQDILKARPDLQINVIRAAMLFLKGCGYNDWKEGYVCRTVLTSLLRRKLPIRQDDVEEFLSILIGDMRSYPITELPTLSVISQVEKFFDKRGLTKKTRQQLQQLTKVYHRDADDAPTRKIGDRIETILEYHSDDKPSKKESTILSNVDGRISLDTGEAWTEALACHLNDQPLESKVLWANLLEHCQKATSSKPSKKWSTGTRTLLDEIGKEVNNNDSRGNSYIANVLIGVLNAVGSPGKPEAFVMGGYRGFHDETQVHSKYINMLRGLVWATAQISTEELVTVVGDMAERCFQKIPGIGPRCPKIGNAALTSLSSLADPASVAQLGRLKARAKHASTRKQIERAFEQAASNAGLDRDDLVELGVPSFEMQEVGILRHEFGSCQLAVNVNANRKSDWIWTNSNGKNQKSVPTAVKNEYADELKLFKKTVAEIDKLMPSIRQRLECLFQKSREWSFEEFRKRFLDHPLVGVIARKLIWNVISNGKENQGIWHDDRFVDFADNPCEIDGSAEFSIWHPIDEDAPENVLQWRDWLMSHSVCQPFKQAHREIYVVTDAELESYLYSNRFAAHIVRQHQLAALCEQRGWKYTLQGQWDSWNLPTLDIPGTELRAEFHVEPIEEGQVSAHMVYLYLQTDQVRFSRLSQDGNYVAIPVSDVPPKTFSEVMRDVDLFVGVTSLGNDPEWENRGNTELINYWEQFAFGDLSETAKTRQSTLKLIVPQLKIADRCSFDGNFLVVEGKIRTYKIHLGSGNILMTPNDQYLCIVRKSNAGSNVFLPFEGDATLSIILSKAFLLADDDKIKDSTITSQIRWRDKSKTSAENLDATKKIDDQLAILSIGTSPAN